MLYSILPFKFWLIAAIIIPVGLCSVLLKLFENKLPKDQGREFAYNGKLSAGKIRGAGAIFVVSFILSSLLFIPLSVEYIFYYVLLFFGMLSGYLDDASEKPWNEYKKGAIDLIISILTAADFVWFNREKTFINFFGFECKIPMIVFGLIAAALVWILINAVNCTDGIDGYCTSLTTVSLISVGLVAYIAQGDKKSLALVALMELSLIPYLWKNAEPSKMLMGDAGSRALGLLLSIILFKSGNVLLIIPLCFMICLDGLLGILKVSLIRFLHIKAFMKIRTPIHDHYRKNKGWSNTQVIFRFCIIQLIISSITLVFYFCERI